jgi:hypothetical protein
MARVQSSVAQVVPIALVRSGYLNNVCSIMRDIEILLVYSKMHPCFFLRSIRKV